MQRISDLYMQSGLFGCTLSQTPSPNYSTCNTGADNATTDLNDNYDRVEVMTGVDQIGSGEGQKQLCGTDSSPFPVDFARSSKPASTSNGCSNGSMVGLGFGKDGVPLVDFEASNSNMGVTGASSPWAGITVGPVASGWIPSDSVTCDTGAPGSSSNPRNTQNGCSGVPFSDLSNSGGTASIAYRLYCATDSTRITDWGQLTNIGSGSTPVGSGTSIGVPIQIANVNTGSGTESTFAGFVASGATCATTDINHSSLLCGGAVVIENNVSQFGDCAAADFPASDATRAADQAAEIASSLYFFSNGVFNTNVHAKTVTFSNGVTTAAHKIGDKTANPGSEDGIGVSNTTMLNNSYPTARTLYNIYRTDSVRASVAGFLDWICDGNNLFQKGTDLQTGQNFDSEVTSAIQSQFGTFIRLKDNTASPNASCQLITVAPAVPDGVVTSGSSTVTSATGFQQPGQTPVVVGDLVTGSGIPNPDYVSTVTANSLTLTAPATASSGGETVTFNIHDPNS